MASALGCWLVYLPVYSFASCWNTTAKQRPDGTDDALSWLGEREGCLRGSFVRSQGWLQTSEAQAVGTEKRVDLGGILGCGCLCPLRTSPHPSILLGTKRVEYPTSQKSCNPQAQTHWLGAGVQAPEFWLIAQTAVFCSSCSLKFPGCSSWN